MGVAAGKFTHGIGQTSLAVPSDREDPVSMALTCANKLLERYAVDPRLIGRLEIGTESMVDRSRSMKSYLVKHLFRPAGHYDLEGATCVMACYGGTSALFNALDWLRSGAAQGRLALVVMTDIARYGDPHAIPTMGAGALAVLLGPHAPVVFAPERASFWDCVDDFYKPLKEDEYPVVNSQLSIHSYLRAVVETFLALHAKRPPLALQNFDFCLFHAPFAKMVQKAFAQLYYADQLLAHGASDLTSRDCLLDGRKLAPVARECHSLFLEKCAPGLALPKIVGNSYTASLYFGLVSLLADPALQLPGKRVLFFSYGSGCAASLFSAKMTAGCSALARKVRESLAELLASRIEISPERLFLRKKAAETNYFRKGYVPEGSTGNLRNGVYFLESVDARYVRRYQRKKERSGGSGSGGGGRGAERLRGVRAQLVGSESGASLWSGFHGKPLAERVDQV